MKTERLVRWLRKAESWDAPLVTNPEVVAEAATLPVFEEFGRYPTSDFWGERPQYFVAVRLNGDRFLVNTEGYTYARYIAKLSQGTN